MVVWLIAFVLWFAGGAGSQQAALFIEAETLVRRRFCGSSQVTNALAND
jgi:hypothetical protein